MVVSRYLALRVEGPLAPTAMGLWGELRERGFTPNHVRTRMRLLLELSRWMNEHGVGLAELNAGMLETLAADARVARRRESQWFAGQWFSSASVRDVLAYLRELGIVEPAAVPAPTQVDLIVARFVEYLARERGTTNRTSVYWYRRIARSFLTGRVDPESGMLAPLTAGEVTAFLLGECRHCSRWGGMRLVSSLRGLLRFLLVDGLVDDDLIAAVPRLPAWSLVRLPKALPAEHAARIVASCDRSTPAGCRDYAILMMLSRIGLRGCEISRLLLEDLDWRAGEVIVRGKREYHERLPLPVDVGDALVDYLRHVRPRPASGDRHVFLTAVRPHVPLNEESRIVGQIVLRASKRAGLGRVGVHRLRHTVATEALRAGAPLEEIASLLRHRDWVTTLGYAKVDWVRLRELARPWPGVLA
jgi:site-specific recombinase XerD